MKAEAQEPGVLAQILASASIEMLARAEERPMWKAAARKQPPAPSFAQALRGPDVRVIAEFKRRSPSAGPICEGSVAHLVAGQYAVAGAAAISVLTEDEFFGGSLDDLLLVSQMVGLPTLRKDFIVDPLQLYEARAAGASAALLIVRAISRTQLRELAAEAHAIGLATLVEVHSDAELEAAIAVHPTAIGVNARDLATFTLDHALVERLVPRIPADVIAVAESGLKTREDVARVARAGADAVLIGTAVAGADDPQAMVRQFVGVEKKQR